MNKSFDNFKKIVWRDIFVKCVLIATVAALWATDVVLLSCLLSGVHLLWAWYLLIALGAFAAAFGVAFLCFRTNDRKIAQRLDKEFALDERAQTAYVYREQTGDMLELQRADCSGALNGVAGKRLKFGNLALIIALIALLVLGAAALPIISVYADTSAEQPTTPVDPPRDVTDWEWQALDDLIDYVKSSQKFTEQAKTDVTSALEGLRGVLQNGVSQSGLTAFVQNTVTQTRNAVSSANEAAGITEQQQTNNSEECDYVVNRLYEIFSLQQDGDENNNPSDNKPDDGREPVSPGNNTGTGELIINGAPFFDPDKGYVSSGDPETRDKYYETIRQAMLEGTISRSEWEYIVSTYFADLQQKDN